MIEIKDIVEQKLCTGCGACVSEAPDKLKMAFNDEGFLVAEQLSSGTSQAVRVCPFNPSPDAEVKDEDALAEIFLPDAPHMDHRVGRYFNSYAGFSNQYRETSSSGGVGTYVFEYLLKNKIVDRLFIVAEANGSYEYQWFDDASQISKISKTRYYPVTLEKLFLEMDSFQGAVAVSGVPSFIKAVRLKQYYHPELKDRIKFLVGIVCGGLKSKFYTDYLAQNAGIQNSYTKQEYRIKDPTSYALDYSFGAYNQENKFKTIKMSQVGNTWGTSLFNAPAYDLSDDLTAELADISLGDAWINPYQQDGLGTSVIVTRSKLAEQIISSGTENGDLSMESIPIDTFKFSQAGGLKHKQLGMKHRLHLLRNTLNFFPYKRERLLENTPLEYRLVQAQRLHLRNKSIEVWKKTPNLEEFERAIEKDRARLNMLTRIYHLIQRVKNKLGMKTL